MDNTTGFEQKSIGREGSAGRGGGYPPGRAPARPAGLSTYHISPSERAVARKNRQARAIIYSGASLLKVEGGSKREWNNHPGKRGSAGFSFASRRRLMRVVAKIPRNYLPVSITLTYPGVFSSDYREWKHNLDLFGKRFLRAWPGSFVIWKLELQKRGAPHYHLLAWGVQNSQKLQKWVSNSWYQVVGSGDLRHLAAGTRCERIRSERGAFSYIAKYTTKKEDEEYKSIGRAWGIIGRGEYEDKVIRPFVIEISAIDADQLLRTMSQMIGASDHEFDSLAILCDAEFWYLSMDCFHDAGRRFSIGYSSMVV